MKTSELTGTALDWAVSEAQGLGYEIIDGVVVTGKQRYENGCNFDELYQPSTNWAQGGVLIEREGMMLALDAFGWEARHYNGESEPWVITGPTPLIAAMRCYVASKLGDTVELPEGLTK